MGIIKDGMIDTDAVFALYNQEQTESAATWEQVRLHIVGEIQNYMLYHGAADKLERNGVEIWRLYQWLFANLGIVRKLKIDVASVMADWQTLTDAINKDLSLPYLARKWGTIETALVADWQETDRLRSTKEMILAEAAGGKLNNTSRDYWSDELIDQVADTGLRTALRKVYHQRKQAGEELTQLLAEVAILRNLK